MTLTVVSDNPAANIGFDIFASFHRSNHWTKRNLHVSTSFKTLHTTFRPCKFGKIVTKNCAASGSFRMLSGNSSLDLRRRQIDTLKVFNNK